MNVGTSFENDALEVAIRNFTGASATFLDPAHPVATEDGTVFRPYDTFSEALNATVTGGVLSIVEGTYTVGASTYTRAMVWEGPVGSVVIE